MLQTTNSAILYIGSSGVQTQIVNSCQPAGVVWGQNSHLRACATDLVESEDGVDLGGFIAVGATLGPGRPQLHLVRVHAVVEFEAIFEESTRDGDLL